MTRFFAAKASSHSWIRWPPELSSVANPLRLSAGRAFPTSLESDIPCRSYGVTTRLPPLAATLDHTPEGVRQGRGLYQRAVSPRTGPPLACYGSRFLSPECLRSARPQLFGEGVGRAVKVLTNPTYRLEHPCCSSRPPACHGCGVPARARLSLATYLHGFHAASEGNPGETRCLSPISATNLLSTSTPETHQLSNTRLSSR
jgi:hypothetical protein